MFWFIPLITLIAAIPLCHSSFRAIMILPQTKHPKLNILRCTLIKRGPWHTFATLMVEQYQPIFWLIKLWLADWFCMRTQELRGEKSFCGIWQASRKCHRCFGTDGEQKLGHHPSSVNIWSFSASKSLIQHWRKTGAKVKFKFFLLSDSAVLLHVWVNGAYLCVLWWLFRMCFCLLPNNYWTRKPDQLTTWRSTGASW